MPAVTPIEASGEALAAVRYDERGLVPAIVQEVGTGTGKPGPADMHRSVCA